MVGASPSPDRPAHGVMRYPLRAGYRVIPVRPLDCDEVCGIPCVATLADIDEQIDLVDVFRNVEACPGHVQEAVDVGAGAVWFQLGLVSPESRRIATEAGLRLRGGRLHRRRASSARRADVLTQPGHSARDVSLTERSAGPKRGGSTPRAEGGGSWGNQGFPRANRGAQI